MAQDRYELLYAAKEAAKGMNSVRTEHLDLLKHTARYVHKQPRVIQLFEWQEEPTTADTYVDANFHLVVKSTSGGGNWLG